MVQTWFFWSEWPWSKPGFSGPNNHGPKIQRNFIQSKWTGLDQEKRYRATKAGFSLKGMTLKLAANFS
jgi:hypothetical protein